MAFTENQLLYILSNISKRPTSIRDETALKRIGNLKEPMTQAEHILIKRPFQDCNKRVAFIVCQMVIEKPNHPDEMIKKYKKWLDLLEKV